MFLSRRGKVSESNILSELETLRRRLLQEGKPVYNLSAGTPDLPPDRHVMETLAREALVAENYKYAISDFPELKEAAIHWYKTRFGVVLTLGQVSSVYGTQEGMAHILFPLCDEGDIVLVPDPGYPVFKAGIEMAGAVPYYTPLLEKNNYLIDFSAIPPEVVSKAKVIIVSYPNNPVTASAPPSFYEELIAFAKKNAIFIIHDNAYCELQLDGEKVGSFLQFEGAADIGVEFNSLSKAYNLTGMRMSFVLGNEEVISAFEKFHSQIDYGPFPAVQKATIAALTGPQDILERNRAEYRRRRDALCESMAALGWLVPSCENTMFVWAPLPPGFTDDVQFTFDLLEASGVIVVPGSSFGESGKGYVRLALVLPPQELRRAMQAIADSGFFTQTP